VTPWSPVEIPDLTGRRALVTGVTSGLGEATVLGLVRRGCEVVMAARGRGKLDRAMADVRHLVPPAQVQPVIVDLADQGSVRRAAEEVATYGPLHLLVNNAGVMATPYRRTVDGFELQMGTNHFGHFALTGLLWPQLVASGDARVVSLGSQAHRMARRAPLDDPRYSHRRYRRWQAYAESKLANLMFAFELERRCEAARLPVRAMAAHPGYASTGLMGNGRELDGRTLRGSILTAAFAVAGQKPEDGCLPTLMAATADLPGGTYVGPGGFLEMHGTPRVVKASTLARDPLAARQLWEISEHVTGVSFP
jgi:NAD(P)-dependent dehydrogenase (short-subunit alcohol dehydrogenase family)